jgi:hypothetical protein
VSKNPRQRTTSSVRPAERDTGCDAITPIKDGTDHPLDFVSFHQLAIMAITRSQTKALLSTSQESSTPDVPSKGRNEPQGNLVMRSKGNANEGQRDVLTRSKGKANFGELQLRTFPVAGNADR